MSHPRPDVKGSGSFASVIKARITDHLYLASSAGRHQRNTLPVLGDIPVRQHTSGGQAPMGTKLERSER